jgi:hypothetical protein
MGFAWDRVLLYAKGGGAVVQDRYDVTITDSGALALFADTKFYWGWTAGAGLEYGLTPNPGSSAGHATRHGAAQFPMAGSTVIGTGWQPSRPLQPI